MHQKRIGTMITFNCIAVSMGCICLTRPSQVTSLDIHPRDRIPIPLTKIIPTGGAFGLKKNQCLSQSGPHVT